MKKPLILVKEKRGFIEYESITDPFKINNDYGLSPAFKRRSISSMTAGKSATVSIT